MKKLFLIVIFYGSFFSPFALANEKGEWALSGFVCSADQQKFKVVHFPKKNPVVDSTWLFNSDGTVSFSIAKEDCITSSTGVYTTNGSTINYTVRSETKQGSGCPSGDKTGQSSSFDFVINGSFLYLKLDYETDGREEACENDDMYQAFIKQ